MTGLELFVIAIATLFLFWKILAIVFSLIEHWQRERLL